MRTLKNIAALACVSALAVPAGVAAQNPGNHGNSGDHGTPQNNKPHHVNKRCKHQPMVGYNARGTLDASSTADSLVVNITKVTSGSKAFKIAYPKQVTIDTHTTTVDYQGTNPFTPTPAADLTKYTVHITGKAPKAKKGCDADNSKSPTFKKVQVKAPESTPEQEQPTTTT
jgi:hypothetical protein